MILKKQGSHWALKNLALARPPEKALNQQTERELPANTTKIKLFQRLVALDWNGELQIRAIQRQLTVKSQHALWVSALKLSWRVSPSISYSQHWVLVCVLHSPSLENHLSLLVPRCPPPQLPWCRWFSWHFGSCDSNRTSCEILLLNQRRLVCVSGQPLSPHRMLFAHVGRGFLVHSIASKQHLSPYNATKWHK